MNTDADIFPPRPKWEGWGYRPDEYSRWISGPWKLIEQLYAELGIRPLPAGESYCAQPPYHKLPLPRADLPAGIILSREATHYIHEDEIPVATFTDAGGKKLKITMQNEDGDKEEVEVGGPAIAVPLYEGRMIGQFDFSEKGWVSGKGRSAIWREIPWEEKQIEPQYMVGAAVAQACGKVHMGCKVGYMRISSSTNSRTMISTYLSASPAGDSVFFFIPRECPLERSLLVAGIFSSLAYDYGIRMRLGGLNVSEFVVVETAVPSPEQVKVIHASLFPRLASVFISSSVFAGELVRLEGVLKPCFSLASMPRTAAERLRVRCMIDAMLAVISGIDQEDLRWILKDVDYPNNWETGRFDSKGLWRVDKDKPPEHRHTVLMLVAFHDLQDKIATCGGDVAKGVEAFCTQNEGEGWMLPETLRLADYGLGHDDRAKQHQPVRSCFGPRFYGWQLAQPPEESWRECHLHARNLLGPEGYQTLLEELEGKTPPTPPPAPATKEGSKKNGGSGQGRLFETDHLPLFPE